MRTTSKFLNCMHRYSDAVSNQFTRLKLHNLRCVISSKAAKLKSKYTCTSGRPKKLQRKDHIWHLKWPCFLILHWHGYWNVPFPLKSHPFKRSGQVTDLPTRLSFPIMYPAFKRMISWNKLYNKWCFLQLNPRHLCSLKYQDTSQDSSRINNQLRKDVNITRVKRFCFPARN